MRIVPDGDGITFVMQSGDSPELYGIVTQYMPQWADLFARKNADYGDGAKILGVRGQYADINRKMLKLKRSLWDGETLEFENSEEVIMDLIGHLFLTLYMLNFREEIERARLFGNLDDSAFVDRFIDELGGPEAALRVSGALSEGLSSQVAARCHELASEGFYEPDADAPVDTDDAEHSAREAVRRFDREVATPAVLRGISINEFEAAQQEAMAKRLKRGTDEQLLKDYPGGLKAALFDHKSAPRDGFANEEFADSDARQHGVGAMTLPEWGRVKRMRGLKAVSQEELDDVYVARETLKEDTLPQWMFHRRIVGSNFPGKNATWEELGDGEKSYWIHEAAAYRRAVARDGFRQPRDASEEAFEAHYADIPEGDNEHEANVGPARIVIEQQDGVTRYYHEAYPGSDREPLVLVPSALIGRLEKDHYVMSKEHEAGLRQLVNWSNRP